MCYRLNVCVFPAPMNSYVEALPSNMMVTGGEAFRRCFDIAEILGVEFLYWD